MKAVFYVYLCLLLLCAGHPVYAGTHNRGNTIPSSSGPVKKVPAKLNIKVPGDPLLDNADLDTDDDYNSDLDEDGGHDKCPSLNYNLAYAGYLTCSFELLSIHYNKRFKTLPPFCGNPAPIYIRQRVLRV
ncbi:MAG TPA: hypothetical protein VGC08_10975 [Pedobacter sp.]